MQMCTQPFNVLRGNFATIIFCFLCVKLLYSERSKSKRPKMKQCRNPNAKLSHYGEEILV